MKESKKNVWSLILTIVKYAVVAALGFLGGDSNVVDLL